MTVKAVLAMLVVCYLAPQGFSTKVSIRLVGGQSTNEGKVLVRDQLKEDGNEKPLCSKYFGVKEAEVVCKQLGYRYSVTVPKAYKSDIPTWIKENTSCHGNETNFGDCFKDRHNCDYKSDWYAAVCCSNSSLFGDWEGSIFRSHCSNSWIGAQTKCERLGTSLTVLGKQHGGLLGQMRNTYFWNGKFFTPWIWSDGCRQMKNGTRTKYTDYTLDNNYPGVCFQHCGRSTGTRFLLSGAVCRCLRGTDDAILTVNPGNCAAVCPGDPDQYCGDGNQTFWDVYKIVKGNSSYGFISFSNTVTLSEARHMCRNSASSWKLTGSYVISGKINSDANGYWLDIESSLAEISNVEDPKFKASTRIDPGRCQAAKVGNTMADLEYQTFECRNTRFLYTCSRSGKWIPPSTTDPLPQSDNPSTAESGDQFTVPTLEITDGSTATEIKTWQLIVVCVGLVVVVLGILGAVCYYKRKHRTERLNRRSPDVNADPGYYSTLNPGSRDSGQYGEIADEYLDPTEGVSQPLHVYEELPGEPNVYLELTAEGNTELNVNEQNETKADGVENSPNVARKESLKLTTSYATPMDTVRGKPGVRRYDSNSMDPKYSFPYDSVESLKHSGKCAITTIVEVNTVSNDTTDKVNTKINDNIDTLNDNPNSTTETLNDNPNSTTDKLNDNPNSTKYEFNDTLNVTTDKFNDIPNGTTDKFNDNPNGNRDKWNGNPVDTTDKCNNTPKSTIEDLNDNPNGTTNSLNDNPNGTTDSLNDNPNGTTDSLNDTPNGITDEVNTRTTVATDKVNTIDNDTTKHKPEDCSNDDNTKHKTGENGIITSNDVIAIGTVVW